jgi:hypothetical protein
MLNQMCPGERDAAAVASYQGGRGRPLNSAASALLAKIAGVDDPTTMPPQPGDQFVFLTGEEKGQLIKAGDLPLGRPELQTYPIDPKSGVARDASRLKLVILICLDTSSLSEGTRVQGS